MNNTAQVAIGQLIKHKLFHYRGVVVDVDPQFMLSEQWYETVAKSRPTKDQPWYHVLVDQSDRVTYVAQQNLELDLSDNPISHPDLEDYFFDFKGGRYVSVQRPN